MVDSSSSLSSSNRASYSSSISSPHKTIPSRNDQNVDRIRSEIFSYINKGAVKKVWIKISQVEKPPSERYAYYTPRKSFLETIFRLKRKEMRNEVKKMHSMKKKALKKEISTDHLAIDHRVVSKKERVKGRYTIEVELASDSLDSKLKKSHLSIDEALSLGCQYVEGMSQLHQLGYAFGDVKPDNCLLYTDDQGKTIVKLSDFGKTKKLGPDETSSYRGNLRYAPPEGRLSHKGDVYGCGLVLIRNLEETFMEKGATNTFFNVLEEEKDMVPDSSFRGVEATIVEHKSFPAFNKNNFLKGLSRRARLDSKYAKKQTERTKVLHDYIDELQKKINLPEEQASKLSTLLKSMVEGDPEKRPTSEEAANTLKAIMREMG